VSEVRRRNEGKDGNGFGGEQEPDAPGDEDAVFFDAAELDTDDTDWQAGPDYKRAQDEAMAGERAVWRVLRGISPRGTWARTKAWQTREGEPVTRVDLHPGGWLALEERIRDLEARAADGDLYRALMAQRDSKAEGETGRESGRLSRLRCGRSLEDVLIGWGGSLAH
jgi:hypothetical protein